MHNFLHLFLPIKMLLVNRACLREAWTSPCHAGLKLVRHLYLHSEIYQIKRWASFTCACSSGSSFLSLWWRCFSNTWRFSTHMQEYSVCVCICVNLASGADGERHFFGGALSIVSSRALGEKKETFFFLEISKKSRKIYGLASKNVCTATRLLPIGLVFFSLLSETRSSKIAPSFTLDFFPQLITWRNPKTERLFLGRLHH